MFSISLFLHQALAELKNLLSGHRENACKHQHNQMLLDAAAARDARLGRLSAESGVDWCAVMALPAFQMFLQEQHGITLYVNGRPLDHGLSDDFILGLSVSSAVTLFEEYDKWHAAKGCWPNETPTGQLIDDLRELVALPGDKA